MAREPQTTDGPKPLSDQHAEDSPPYSDEMDDRVEAQPRRQLAKPTKTEPRIRRRRRVHPVDDADFDTTSTALQPAQNQELEPAQRPSIHGELVQAPATGAGQLARQQGAEQQQIRRKEKSDDSGLKLRLDLNLDVEVELKATIHGDLTLSLLG